MSNEAGEFVEDERTGDRDVEAGTCADHRDLDGQIEQFQRIWRDSGPLVPEYYDRPAPGGGKVRKPNRFIRQLDTDDRAATIALAGQPPAHVTSDPVDARPTAKGVAASERVRNPRQSRNGHARAHRITAAQQRSQIRFVKWPEWRGDQVIPA